MHQSQLFTLTRLRLATWYAGVMGVILSLSGMAIYYIMAQAHWHGLHQELESVTGTLHDTLEPTLRQPGQIEAEVEQALPRLCIATKVCEDEPNQSSRQVMGVVYQSGYYVRFLSLSETIVATLGYQPEGLPIELHPLWQTMEDRQGDRYHHISLLLQTATGEPWGYIQVGRSLKDFDDHLASLRWILLIGLPGVFALIMAASWGLSGLAMRPVYLSYSHIQQFTADVAHELRTPLAAIRATLESVLQVPHLSEIEARSTLQTIERQNLRLAQLVQDLLLLSRLDRQERSHHPQPCCLNDLLSDVVEELAALAIAADLILVANVANSPLYVCGDAENLYRLFNNLVINAIQYTLPGGKVVLSLAIDHHDVLIQVQDTGIGIAPSEQARIFERFYRVQSDRSRATGGSGLGLAIAQAIAQTHHGTIQVQSELGKGSTFTVRLPRISS
jgi:signal transduction histidine kinase